MIVSITSVKRLEDMSSVGRLHLMLDGDSDVIVSVHPQTDDGLIGNGANVEFCTIGLGGGGSPRTYQALRELMKAMALDNLDTHYASRKCEDEPLTIRGE